MKVEEGDIKFVTHPRHGHSGAVFEETDHYFVVLSPEDDRHRLIEMGRKRAPEIELGRASTSGHSLGVVRRLADDASSLSKYVHEECQDHAKVIAAGKYLINDHGNHTDLVYAVDIPAGSAGEADHLGIEGDEALVLSVQNPEGSLPPGFPRAVGMPPYPSELLDLFNGSKFVKLTDRKLLDFENSFLVLVERNSMLVHAELKLLIDEEAEEEEAADNIAYLRTKQEAEPTAASF